ncbi:hypothetical protein [Clostridium sp. DJ247]|nr:hypothetical protein [Clostridium sp. DJ247]
MFKKFITFGEMKAKNIVEYIFGTGLIISIYSSYFQKSSKQGVS